LPEPPTRSPLGTTARRKNPSSPFQLIFALDRVKALAPQHPEWKDKEPFASLLKGDLKGARAGGEKALLEMAMATHAGMTAEEFEKIAGDWLATAKHPKTGRRVHDKKVQIEQQA